MSDDVRDAFPEPDDTAPQDDHLDDGGTGTTTGSTSGRTSGPEPGRQDARPERAAPAAEVEHTGNPVVDSVLDSLRELDQVPVSEHVAVFEAAHDRLRGALADAGEPPADS